MVNYNDTILLQYEAVRGSRDVLLKYCSDIPADLLNQPLDSYNNSSMVYLLVHVCNTYKGWLGRFGLQQQADALDTTKSYTITEIESEYYSVNELVQQFIETFSQRWLETFTRKVPGQERVLTVTPLQLFTHVITHEFHHKGQLLNMSRLLGFVPVDTDVIR